MNILVTGGTGYIGSHTVVKLLEAGNDVVIVDNLINSKADVVDKIEKLAGRRPQFFEVDILDEDKLRGVFSQKKVDAVIHFAGLKAVGESVQKPLEYYHNNITGTLVLLSVMREFGVKNLVFSSSATVYGSPKSLPIREDFPLSTTNPYGSTKLFIEYILKDVCKANPDMNVALLRYFNPIGAHKSGLIGENPNGIPNNLMPYITQVAFGKLPYLRVFGNDYDTPDGTGVRDYIHVLDLARGHLLALEKLYKKPGLVIYNLGTGVGYSVLDMVKTFEKVSGVPVPYKIVERRAGDIASCYADPTLARRELGFETEYTLEDMCRDSYNFQRMNG